MKFLRLAESVVFFMVSMAVVSCGGRPEGVLSDDRMADLMADMQLAEAYSSLPSSGRGMTREQRDSLGRGVLAANGITQAELDSSLSWYGRNMDTYTELYEKVDKRIAEKRKRLLNDGIKEEADGDNLWPYPAHGIISGLASSDGYLFSITNPELVRGNALEWKMRVSPATSLNMMLGVEYADGSDTYVSRSFSSERKVELHLQTDTARDVRRVYGVMRVARVRDLPVFTDSISLQVLPLDSAEYYRIKGQKSYYGPHRRTKGKMQTFRTSGMSASGQKTGISRELENDRK